LVQPLSVWSDRAEFLYGDLHAVSLPKTERNIVPLFPRVREVLDKAREGAKLVIRRRCDSESDLRTHLHRTIRSAGYVPWPKAFVFWGLLPHRRRVSLPSMCATAGSVMDRLSPNGINSWTPMKSERGRMIFGQRWAKC